MQWNVRGIGGGGNYFGGYARVAADGGPINYALGASEHSFNWLLKKLEDAGLDANHVLTEMKNVHTRIVSNGAAMFGSDIGITKDGEVVAYEINYGNFGGLENVVQYEQTLDNILNYTNDFGKHSINERDFEKTFFRQHPTQAY